MRKMLALFGFTMLFSAAAFAEDWTGKLIDSSCYDRQQQQTPKGTEACLATSQSTSFALNVDGKVYKLDAGGNSQAMTALRNRADRTAPGKEQPHEISAKVAGTMTGTSIKVDKIELQ